MTMKYTAFIIALFLSVSVQAQTVTNFVKDSIPRPVPARLVNDLANVLTPDQEQALESKLVAYDDSTSTQIVIVTVPTLHDIAIEDIGLEILRSWGVGQKGKDNGIVILAAIQDRDITIRTGYGMEGAVPDITGRNIIETDIVPAFRQGNYYRGFDNATSSIFKAAAGEYKAEPRKSNGKGGGISIGKIIAAFILLMFLMNRMGGGGKGGGYMSRRGYRGFGGGPVFLPGGFGGGGFGGGGFGGGGGGFGGFGGGGGGGGGASGSW